jgi:hypothetical protein
VKRADRPFEFFTASYITRIDNQRAQTLGELRHGLERCSDASIFYHTFQSSGATTSSPRAFRTTWRSGCWHR